MGDLYLSYTFPELQELRCAGGADALGDTSLYPAGFGLEDSVRLQKKQELFQLSADIMEQPELRDVDVELLLFLTAPPSVQSFSPEQWLDVWQLVCKESDGSIQMRQDAAGGLCPFCDTCSCWADFAHLASEEHFWSRFARKPGPLLAAVLKAQRNLQRRWEDTRGLVQDSDHEMEEEVGEEGADGEVYRDACGEGADGEGSQPMRGSPGGEGSQPKGGSPPTPMVQPMGEKAVYCGVCDMKLNGPTQWESHKIGKKHKKNVKRRLQERGHHPQPQQDMAEKVAKSEEASVLAEHGTSEDDGGHSHAHQPQPATSAWWEGDWYWNGSAWYRWSAGPKWRYDDPVQKANANPKIAEGASSYCYGDAWYCWPPVQYPVQQAYCGWHSQCW